MSDDDESYYTLGMQLPDAEVVDAEIRLEQDGYAVVDDATLDALAARGDIEPTGGPEAER